MHFGARRAKGGNRRKRRFSDGNVADGRMPKRVRVGGGLPGVRDSDPRGGGERGGCSGGSKGRRQSCERAGTILRASGAGGGADGGADRGAAAADREACALGKGGRG